MSGCVQAPVQAGVLRLVDDELGTLDLSGTGWVPVGIQVGFPGERGVLRNRALNDGAYDDTAFLGGRVVTATLRMNTRELTAQALEDAIMPFMHPRRRPQLVWSRPGTPTELRRLTVRGVDAPIEIDGPKYPFLVVSFFSTDAYKRGPEQHCQTIVPSAEGETGRVYDLTFDREYDPALPIGGFNVHNAGTAPADWVATVFGPATNPILNVRGIQLTTEDNGGVDLLAGQTLVIDTAARTVQLNGDPAEPRYDRTNYLDWEWEDLRLLPGDNLLSFNADVLDPDAAVTICWDDTWL